MSPTYFKHKHDAEQYLTVMGYIADEEQEIDGRPLVWLSRNGLVVAYVVRDQNEHGGDSYHLEYCA